MGFGLLVKRRQKQQILAKSLLQPTFAAHPVFALVLLLQGCYEEGDGNVNTRQTV